MSTVEPETPQAVVFDCDGVLADSDAAWYAVEVEMCARNGLDRTSIPVDTHGLSMQDSVALLLPSVTDVELELATAEFVSIAEHVVPDRVLALPGAVDAVRRWSELMPVAVASNSPRRILGSVLSAIGIAGDLAFFIAADEVALPKPAPDLYTTAVSLLGSSPERTWVFEDSVAGIAAAQAAGCKVVQVCTRSLARQAGVLTEADTVSMTPTELLGIIRP